MIHEEVLSPGETQMLAALRAAPSVTAPALAKETGLDPVTIKRALHMFEFAGVASECPRAPRARSPKEYRLTIGCGNASVGLYQGSTITLPSVSSEPLLPSFPAPDIEEVPAPPALKVAVGVLGIIEPETQEPVLIDEPYVGPGAYSAPMIQAPGPDTRFINGLQPEPEPPDDGAPQIAVPVPLEISAIVDVPSPVLDREIMAAQAAEQRRRDKAVRRSALSAPPSFRKPEEVAPQIRKLTDSERRAMSTAEILEIARQNAEIRKQQK